LDVDGPVGTLRLGATGVDSTVTLASVGKVKIGALNGQFRASTSIGSINARSIDGAVIFAGVPATQGPGLPDSLAFFDNPAATIGSIVTRSFMFSKVAAPSIGRLSLGQIGIGNPGVGADRIGVLVGRHHSGGPLRLRNLDGPESSVVIEDLEVVVL
jgi:hypothetical protein